MTTDAPEPHSWDPEREEAEAEASPERGTRRWWLIGGVLVAVAIGLTVWFGLASSQEAVSSTDIGFEHRGDREVVMTFDVTRPPGTTVTCTVAAMDGDYARVGTTEHEIPAAEESTTRVRASVQTTTRAVTATVQDCAATDGN